MFDTDASNVGIGAVLSQVHQGHERVIAYYSRALSKTECNYCTTRRGLLGIVKAIDHFHPYLYGRKFTIKTDHASLQWLLNFKNLEGQVARWLDKLQTYDFCIVYRTGRNNQNADVLSRRPWKQHETTKFTPAMLMFGRELRVPFDLLIGRPQEQPEDRGYPEYVERLRESVETVKFTTLLVYISRKIA